MLRCIDMYQSMSLRCTILIVTAEYLFNDTALGIVCHTFVQFCRGIT